MNSRYVDQVLEDGERLLRQLEERERERAERYRRQKCVKYVDQRGNLHSLLMRETRR